MIRLEVRTLESPIAVAGYSSSINGGGHKSIRSLQASVLWPRRPSKQNKEVIASPERAELIADGARIYRFSREHNQWFPYQEVTLQYTPY